MEDSEVTGITWDNLMYIVDFLELSGQKKVSLLGGEPTLHPRFVDFTLYLLERSFHVNIFTSGIMSESRLWQCRDFLSKYPHERLSFTCNLNHPSISAPAETSRVEAFLEIFGPVSVLSFNVYTVDFDMNFLVETIDRFNMRRHIRIGLAHPIPGEINRFIPAADLKKMAGRLSGFFDLLEKSEISPGFDCGMPMCLFSDADIGRLFKLNQGMVNFGCGPAIDIGPDMMVWACFPLSNVNKRSLYEFNNLQEIDSYYKELHASVRKVKGGVFDVCDDCQWRKKELCRGGCIAHIMNQVPDKINTGIIS